MGCRKQYGWVKRIKRSLPYLAAIISFSFLASVVFLFYEFVTTKPQPFMGNHPFGVRDVIKIVTNIERTVLQSLDNECDHCCGSVNSQHSSLTSLGSIGKDFAGKSLSDGRVNGTSAFEMLHNMQSAGVRFDSLGQYARGIRFQSYLSATPLRSITPVANFLGSLAVPLHHHGLYFTFRLSNSTFEGMANKSKTKIDPRVSALEAKTYMWFDLKSSGIHWNISHDAPASVADSWSDDAILEPRWVVDFLELHQDRSWHARSWNCQHFAYEFKKYMVNRCNAGPRHGESCPTMDFHATMPSYYNAIASVSWAIPFILAGSTLSLTGLYLRRKTSALTLDASSPVLQPLLPGC
jgi:hypothetical protein